MEITKKEKKKLPWDKISVVTVVVLMVMGVFFYKSITTADENTKNPAQVYEAPQKQTVSAEPATKNENQAVLEVTQTQGQEQVISQTAETIQASATVPQIVPKQESEVQSLPRLIDFGATMCKPCQDQAPILNELKTEYAGRVDVDIIDVYENRADANKYKIRVIPTQIFLDANGNEYMRHEGFMPKSAIVAVFTQMGVK